MGRVGFGSYRISIKSSEHKEALIEALRAGCTFIDTSANYTSGESESLIGAVLAEHKEWHPQIATKAGYIQGATLENLRAGIPEVVEVSENLKHSIHPDFLREELTKSLSRLKRSKVDYFLLHNPEYYFKGPSPTREEYYERIGKAFLHLEEEVAAGRIGAYGLSSNTLIVPSTDTEATSLLEVLKVARKIGAKHFKMAQFPFNLIEMGALAREGEFGSMNVIETCMQEGLLSVGNRPLNAFVQNGLLRLATYEDDVKKLDEGRAEKLFLECMDLVRAKWIEHSDETTTADDFDHLDLIAQMKKLWKTLPSPDAVDQVYFGHFFPFIARVWQNGLNAQEAKPFYELLEFSYLYSRKNLTERARKFEEEAQKGGLLGADLKRPLAVKALETYLDYGLDYVLVGMRKKAYVEQIKHLF